MPRVSQFFNQKRPADKIRRLNELYAAAVRGNSQVTLLDTWTLFADDDGDAKPSEFPDLLHPNQLGYAKWAAALRPVLATLGFLETAGDFVLEEGYRHLFNGRDLSGWGWRPSSEADIRAAANWKKRDPNAPPWPIVSEPRDFAGRVSSDDGRYVALHGRLVVTTPSEGRRIQQLWTTEDFADDFTLKLEFRATPNADSGIFLRGRQLQCRDYALAGPYKSLKAYRPQDWNEIVVRVRGTKAHCTCNGELLEEAFEIPNRGPIGLEGDRGQVEYRRIRIRTQPGLPASTPEAQGISSRAILKFLSALEQIEDVHSCIVVRNGTMIANGWWAPYESQDPHMLYSLSKSFTSTAVGLAIAEGKLSLDDTVTSFFPDQVPASPTWQLKAMRVRDLLAMSTGHHGDAIRSFDYFGYESPTKQFLSLPVEHKPGTHFVYNTPATYMCSAIVQKVTGESVLDYLRSRLFEPLGMSEPSWSQSAEGVSMGGFGLSVTTLDIAKLGQLYLQNGTWEGRQILPASWVQAATMRQTSNGSNPTSDWDQGYGYQFWRCRHGNYRGDGAFGQFCIVMPSQNAVVAITSGVRDMQAVMNAVWDHLLPAMQTVPMTASHEDYQELQDRLTQLSLPQPEGASTSSAASRVSHAVFKFPANKAQLESIAVSCPAEGNVTLELKSRAGEHRIECGTGRWVRQRVPTFADLDYRRVGDPDVAIAASGAWTADDTYTAKLYLYETPYCLTLRMKFDDETIVFEPSYNVSIGNSSRAALGLEAMIGKRVE